MIKVVKLLTIHLIDFFNKFKIQYFLKNIPQIYPNEIVLYAITVKTKWATKQPLNATFKIY